MKIIITGGTGFIGSHLTDNFLQKNHEVVILTRNPHRESTSTIRYVLWNPQIFDVWTKEIDGSDVVINLAGHSIGDGRWTKKRKEQIYKSRIDATRAVVESIGKATKKPSVLINASAIGYYDHTIESEYTEDSPPGNDFLASVCKVWEGEASRVKDYNVRLAIIRFGLILGRGGGVLPRLLLPFKLFAGGPLGSGKQWMQWIHIDDLIGIFNFVVQNDHIDGVLNATAPNPVTNRELSKLIGKILKRPAFFPAPSFMLQLVLGKELANTLLLNGQKVYPKRTMELGYKFKFVDVENALENLLKKSGV